MLYTSNIKCAGIVKFGPKQDQNPACKTTSWRTICNIIRFVWNHLRNKAWVILCHQLHWLLRESFLSWLSPVPTALIRGFFLLPDSLSFWYLPVCNFAFIFTSLTDPFRVCLQQLQPWHILSSFRVFQKFRGKPTCHLQSYLYCCHGTTSDQK